MNELASTHELVDGLAARGIRVWLEGDALRYRAPRNALDAELKQTLQRRKQEILDLLKRRSSVAPRSPASKIEPDPQARFEPFPLTDIQQAYWVGRTAAFDLNLSAHFYKEREIADLDLQRLARVWRRMIEHHEMLRAVVTSDGQQRILQRIPAFQIPLIDMRGIAPPAAEEQLSRLRRQMKRSGPSLDEWPLFDFCATLRPAGLVHLHFSLSLLICDALSSDLLFRQFLKLYESPDMPLAPLQISFRDYVMATLTGQAEAARQRSLEYWRQRLKSLPPAPELPLARSPGSLRRPRFVRFWGSLKPALCRRLKEKARKAGLTLTALIAAAYAETVARWSKGQHLLLNVLFFNRPQSHPQINQIVGNFSTTILLEYDGRQPGSSFEERAQLLQEQLWADIEHAQVSGIQVLRESHHQRGSDSRSAVPIVLASTIGLTQTTGTVLGAEEEERPEYDSLQTPQVWLDHQVGERDGGLFFNWDGVEDLFPAGLLQSMFKGYCRVLERLSADEDAWQRSALNLLPAKQSERRQAANATQREVEDALLHSLAHRQAERRPDHPAVVCGDEALTYGELWRLAEHFSRRLGQMGVKPNSLVAVVMEKGWEQVAAVLAILQSGAAYLPIDPSLPRQRRWHLLRHGQAEAAMVQPGFPRQEFPPEVELVEVERRAAAAGQPIAQPPVQNPDNLAYVIYTSGSTGLPKGVMISHRAAVNTILDINRRFQVGPGDRVLALSSLSFDLSVYDIFGVLAAGGTVVLPPSDAAPDPARWMEQLSAHGVTIWNSVPALMQMLADYLEGHGQPLSADLRLVMMSGDWIPLQLPDRIRALSPSTEVISLGGATEAAIWSIFHPAGRFDPDWTSIPYGRPLANQAFHVLNQRLEDCPDWVAGHLFIEGAGLAMGYWRDPEKTRASFLTHPRTGRRIYRTGDLGRYLPDGNIEILGREDFQVKVQGYRIELGEIEASLAQHPLVRQAVAAAVGEARGSKRLVAFAVLRQGGPDLPSSEELLDYLAAKLPPYMVPSRLSFLDELPLTPNGKVDRAALADLETGGRGSSAGFAAPRNDLELRLAQLWQEALQRPLVGVQDDFFESGGHSLTAVRLMTRIGQEFGCELPLSSLFEAPTIQAQAALLKQSRKAPIERAALIGIKASGSAPPFFCMHPVGGNVFCYLELARHLEAKQPLYGLQADSSEEAGKDGASLEGMASRYVSAIRRQQPQGPYHLGGWSMGGVLAYEMACQIDRQGGEVASLAVIDAARPGCEVQAPEDDLDLLLWFGRDLAGQSGQRLAIDRRESAPLSQQDRLSYLAAQIRSAQLPLGVGEEELAPLFAVFRRNFKALLAYRPPAYAGSMLLLRARQGDGAEAEDGSLGWSSCARGGVAVEELEGNHYSIMQPPQAEALARLLTEYLNRGEGMPFANKGTDSA